MILAGDVGGTKTRLGLFSYDGVRLHLTKVERYASGEFPSFAEIVKKFLAYAGVSAKEIERACFGIPGPVINGMVKVTNLPWEFGEKDLSKELGIPKIRLVNDLVSTAAAIPTLPEKSFTTIYSGLGTHPFGPSVVVAPGTGLGHALLHRSEKGSITLIASEGGHANFAPTCDTQYELLKYIQKTKGHASVESLVCGPGVTNIYSFLRDTGKYKENSELAAALQEGDDAGVIAKRALDGDTGICGKTMELFMEILGAHASNIMLTFLATGGVYLGGGIPPKILPLLQGEAFLKGYLMKGKCKDKVEATPVRVIADDSASLHGAAEIARGL